MFAKVREMPPLFRKTLGIAIFALVCTSVFLNLALAQVSQPFKGTAAINLIRPEYYAAIDFISDGQSAQAAAVLDSALAQVRTVNEQRGIDSVPVLVMMGECFLEQCDIGMALEKYDAALQISLMSQRWLSLLKNPSGTFRAENRAKEIPWGNNSRGTQMGVYTEAWPITLAAPDSLVELSTGQNVVGKMVAIDALEILRCQAIAIRRRFLLLGPLAKQSPMHVPLLEGFRAPLNALSEPLVCSMNICRALAEMCNGDKVESIRLLKQNLSLANGLDHPLTAVALLTLTDLAVEMNEMPEAKERAMEAMFASARAGQMDHLAESMEYFVAASLAIGHDAMIVKMLPQFLNWSSNKSRLVTIRGQVEWARTAAHVGDLEGFKKHANSATTMLLPKPIVLPRAEASLRVAKARIEFLEGKVGDGINTLLESIAFLRSQSSGVGAPTLFQLNLAQSLIKSNVLKEDIAEPLLVTLLNSPSAGNWRIHPLEQFAWLFADKSDAMRLLADIQIRKRSDAEMVVLWDENACKRYRQQGELESRVFDIQMAFHCDKRSLNPAQITQAALIRDQIPNLEQNAVKIAELIAPLKANPKWDTRKWSEDESRRWETSLRISDAQESLAWAAAIGPLVVPEVFPPRHNQAFLDKSLQSGDSVIYFVFHGDQLRGYLFQSGKWRSWIVENAELLQRNSMQILNDLMLLTKRDGSLSELKKSWTVAKRIEIRNQLFPADVWSQLLSSERWIVVPDRFLWYLPLETLPISSQAYSLPCIAEHRIVYSPTLGLVPQLIDTKNVLPKTVSVDVHGVDFLSKSPTRAKEIREELASPRKHVIVDLGGKATTFPASRFFKVVSDQLCTFVPSTWDSISPVPTDRVATKSNIPSWRRLPWGAPASIMLPGVNAIPPPTTSTGDEWSRLTLPLIAQGTRHFTISRWPVGGESTVSMMVSFDENRQDMTVSEAWQRSVVSLWEEQFDQRTEPIFQNTVNSNVENSVTGAHPLLWSGYVLIGDAK